MATPTSTEQVVTNIPKYAEPAYTRLLSDTEKFATQPYQFYEGQRFSEINPLQEQYMEAATNLTPSEQLQTGTDFARRASEGALNGGIFDLAAANQYMSPYIQNVLNVQKQNAMRDYNRQIPAMQAAGVRFGGLGGTRGALAQSEGMRNLQNSLQGIDATGLQNAFQQAQTQYNTDQSRRMQGYSTALQGANALNQLGESDFNQRLHSIDAQRNAGQDLYGLEQQQRDFDYNQFVEAQNLPFKQLGLRNDVIHGAPASDTTTTVYGAQPNSATQNTGLLGAAMTRLFNRGGLTGGLGGLYMSRGA